MLFAKIPVNFQAITCGRHSPSAPASPAISSIHPVGDTKRMEAAHPVARAMPSVCARRSAG